MEQNSTTFTTSDMSLAVNNLVAFTSYSFNISASTRVGTGPVSGAITETTLEEGILHTAVCLRAVGICTEFLGAYIIMNNVHYW